MATFNSNNSVFRDSLPVRTAENSRCNEVSNCVNAYSNGNGNTNYPKKSNRIQLPSGTFRSDSYDKMILLSDGQKTRRFHFSIEQGYWDDPNYGYVGYETYRLYILSFPCKPDYDCSASHEAHMFYDDDRCDFFICWDQPITSFEDANAIAFVWAKRFLNHCMSNSVAHKRVYLPSGTFRSKGRSRKKKHSHNRKNANSSMYVALNSSVIKDNDDIDFYDDFDQYINDDCYNAISQKDERTIYMTQSVYDEIKCTIGSHCAEQGGMLGSSDGEIIDTFIYDRKAVTNAAAYSPNIDYLNDVLNEWNEKNIVFKGFVHSHPVDCVRPSFADENYCDEIMAACDIEDVFMPIVITKPDRGKFKLYPYIIGRSLEEGTYCRSCDIELVEDKCKLSEISEFTNKSTISEKQIQELFDSQDLSIFEKNSDVEPHVFDSADSFDTADTNQELADTAFDRVSNVIDLDVMARTLVIGIGCGGAREFYIDLARTGVKNFILLDGDTVSTSNLSSQNVYSSEIGKYKTDVIKNRILEINSESKVISVSEFLTDQITDGWFESMFNLFNNLDNILLCAFTDSFNAQARCIRLAMKYNLKYISAQHYSKGLVSEIIYWHPGYSLTTPRAYLANRYFDYLENGFKNDVTSKGSPIFNTVRLNGLCEKIACGLLLSESKKCSLYSEFIERCPEKNLILLRQHSINGVFPELEKLFEQFSANPMFDDCIWLSAEDMELEKVSNKDEIDYLKSKNRDADTRILN